MKQPHTFKKFIRFFAIQAVVLIFSVLFTILAIGLLNEITAMAANRAESGLKVEQTGDLTSSQPELSLLSFPQTRLNFTPVSTLYLPLVAKNFNSGPFKLEPITGLTVSNNGPNFLGTAIYRSNFTISP